MKTVVILVVGIVLGAAGTFAWLLWNVWFGDDQWNM